MLEYIIIQALYNKNGSTEFNHLKVKKYHKVWDLFQWIQS